MMLEFSDTNDHRLISHEIIFEVFPLMRSSLAYLNVTTADGRTDGQLAVA